MVSVKVQIVAIVVQKPISVRDLGPVDISRLLPAVAQIPDGFWKAEDAVKANAFGCFPTTQHILFRFVGSKLQPWDFHDKPIWPVWRPLLMPVIEQAVAAYGFAMPEVAKAMLARLPKGGLIKRHRDGVGTNLCTHKIHVPLITNPQAVLEAGRTWTHLEQGRAYEVNNIAAHSARNDGDQDRIHFIFEVFEGAQDRSMKQGVGEREVAIAS